MMPVGDLFVHVYVLVDDALRAGLVPIPSRPGPAPVCSDAEVLTIALVRHLLGRPSERGFLAEVRRDWHHEFPAPAAPERVPAQRAPRTPVGCGDRMAGRGPTGCAPALGGMLPTASGSLVFAWPGAPICRRAWSGPGASSRRR